MSVPERIANAQQVGKRRAREESIPRQISKAQRMASASQSAAHSPSTANATSSAQVASVIVESHYEQTPVETSVEDNTTENASKSSASQPPERDRPLTNVEQVQVEFPKGWWNLESDANRIVCAAYADGCPDVTFHARKHKNGIQENTPYKITFATLQQRNLLTGRCRRVRFVPRTSSDFWV